MLDIFAMPPSLWLAAAAGISVGLLFLAAARTLIRTVFPEHDSR
jgi:hypothetical protein